MRDRSDDPSHRERMLYYRALSAATGWQNSQVGGYLYCVYEYTIMALLWGVLVTGWTVRCLQSHSQRRETTLAESLWTAFHFRFQLF